MRAVNSLLLLLAASLTEAVESPHNKAAKYAKRANPPVLTKDAPRKRDTSQFLTNTTSKFAVNGSALPEIDFNIGESYAGTLPISANSSDPNQLWFWFFPSSNPLASKEITIWLNGGPGCSSLDGLFQENGPFIWQSGTYAPISNPYSWTNLTNMIYIDQPVSTGFSPGNILVNNEHDVAEQFKGFWKNFIDTFSLHGYKVYITGESYAGQYIPYIASGMLDTNDTKYFNVKGVQINDPSINEDSTMIYAPVVPALKYYQNVIGLNETYMAGIEARAESCGFTAFHDKWTSEFPPSGPIPTAPDWTVTGCDLYDDIYNAIDVQAVIHAPPTDYYVCGAGPNLFPHGDQSVPSALGPLASVIERTNNTIIGHGLLDFLLFSNGSLITIQNLTWNGLQGFQAPPSYTQNFFVPYHQSLGEILDYVNGAVPNSPVFTDTAGAGYQGTWHTERGLTFVTVNLAGHEIPQYVPGAAYRQLEFLLGRIPDLSTQGDYTTQTGNFTGTTPPLKKRGEGWIV
ncbi:Carboxypeptidase [Lachnellula hyalina]|uniref:Carboxypeptidase n=1 Tax=Lachnellula hyalina TaxID=1316788 RepID=A0A8H8TYN9_9HELO|nr:Carboxypeptidase [Lachnellula hyalina]TVY25102.1 Carboxypeptidase [Lachnellula hyalina]